MESNGEGRSLVRAEDNRLDIEEGVERDTEQDIAIDAERDFEQDRSQDLARDSEKDNPKDLARDFEEDSSKDIRQDIAKGLSIGSPIPWGGCMGWVDSEGISVRSMLEREYT